MHKEMVIISGKGGTGKTSISASFAVLADGAVIADCDVDAADLHLLLEPSIRERHQFRSGHKAVIHQENCLRCGLCLANCRFGAVIETSARRNNCSDCSFCVRSCPIRIANEIEAMRTVGGDTSTGGFWIDPIACEGCGVCRHLCPANAIDFPKSITGEWMLSDTRCGPLIHARLFVGAENSGKLVSTVREQARQVANKLNRSLIIIDGPPGIGCPVIATVTGASQVLIVSEPTVSGEHDLLRALELVSHFNVPASVCVNKWDLNPEKTKSIEEQARKRGARVLGRLRYDQQFTAAQLNRKTVVETGAAAASDIRQLWKAFIL